jgi:hypothetical protein
MVRECFYEVVAEDELNDLLMGRNTHVGREYWTGSSHTNIPRGSTGVVYKRKRNPEEPVEPML